MLPQKHFIIAKDSEYPPSMDQGKRTVSGSSSATQPPPCSAVPPSSSIPLPLLGTVRPIEQTPPEEDEDYIPYVSGKDHPEYIAGRRNLFRGMTREESLEGKLLSSWDAYITVEAKVDEYLQSQPPLKEREFTAHDRKRMDEVALKLYQAVGEGKGKLVQFSAPSLFEECACAREK
jgi:hypothetical protein